MKLTTLKPRIQSIKPRIAPAQVERLRGDAAVKRRRLWLYHHPLCVRCEAEDRTTAATVPDHKVPIWSGGADNESNLQSLCAGHHDAKSACEARMRASGGWLSTPCTCGQHED